MKQGWKRKQGRVHHDLTLLARVSLTEKRLISLFLFAVMPNLLTVSIPGSTCCFWEVVGASTSLLHGVFFVLEVSCYSDYTWTCSISFFSNSPTCKWCVAQKIMYLSCFSLSCVLSRRFVPPLSSLRTLPVLWDWGHLLHPVGNFTVPLFSHVPLPSLFSFLSCFPPSFPSPHIPSHDFSM